MVWRLGKEVETLKLSILLGLLSDIAWKKAIQDK